MMQARVVTVQIQPDKLDEAVEIYRDSVVPAAREYAGNKVMLLLTDRATGRGLSVSLWAGDDLAASEASGYLQGQFAKFGSVFSAPPLSEVFDVAIFEPVSRDPTAARVTRVQIKPGMTAEAEDALRTTLLPRLREQAGFMGLMLLTDQSSGKAVTLTAWNSTDELHASEAQGGFYEQALAELARFTVGPATREVFTVGIRSVNLG